MFHRKFPLTCIVVEVVFVAHTYSRVTAVVVHTAAIGTRHGEAGVGRALEARRAAEVIGTRTVEAGHVRLAGSTHVTRGRGAVI